MYCTVHLSHLLSRRMWQQCTHSFLPSLNTILFFAGLAPDSHPSDPGSSVSIGTLVDYRMLWRYFRP